MEHLKKKKHLEGLVREALEVHHRLFVVRILQGDGGSEVLATFFPFKSKQDSIFSSIQPVVLSSPL